jgi:hypothetical protein
VGSIFNSNSLLRAANRLRVSRCNLRSRMYNAIDNPDIVMLTDHTKEMLVIKLKARFAVEVTPAKTLIAEAN